MLYRFGISPHHLDINLFIFGFLELHSFKNECFLFFILLSVKNANEKIYCKKRLQALSFYKKLNNRITFGIKELKK